jgi:hypothetical protein
MNCDKCDKSVEIYYYFGWDDATQKCYCMAPRCRYVGDIGSLCKECAILFRDIEKDNEYCDCCNMCESDERYASLFYEVYKWNETGYPEEVWDDEYTDIFDEKDPPRKLCKKCFEDIKKWFNGNGK